MEVIQKFLTNTSVFRANRDGHTPRVFVIHKQAGNGMLYNFFQGGSRGSSTHYQVMKTGQVYQFVREEHTAYANGVWNWNVRGLSIEFEGMDTDAVTNAQYENCSQLIAQLSKKYGFPCEYRDKASLANLSTKGITIHKNLVSTACPANVDYMRVINRAREILNINTTPVATVTTHGGTFSLEDCYRICRNLSGVDKDYGYEWNKWVANPDQGIIDVLNWRDYKNETCKQKDSLQTELNAVKGILNEKDGQINTLNASVNDLNTKLAICTQEKQELLIRADKIDAEFSDFKASSEADKENLEEDINKKASAIEVLTKNNERLQEELRTCQANTGGGVNPDPSITILARFIEWIRKLLAKIPSKKS